MKQSTILSLAAASASLLTACLFQGESDSKGSATVQMDIRASASAALAKSSDLILGDTSGAHVVLTEAKLAISRIKLHSESESDRCDSAEDHRKKDDSSKSADEVERECEDDEKVAFAGPFIVDLLTGTSTPPLGSLSVPAGPYRKVKVELHQGQNGSALDGKTLVAAGSVTFADGTTRPFNLSLTLNENLKIKSKSGLTLDAGTVNTVAISILAGNWLKGLDLAGCLAGAPAGALVITEKSDLGKCLDAEHRIKDNFRDAFETHEKEHTDGKDSTNSGKDK
jgi:hypothetical protein